MKVQVYHSSVVEVRSIAGKVVLVHVIGMDIHDL